MPTHARTTHPRPTLRQRVRAAYDRVGYHTFMITATVYVAAETLIGFESVALLLSYVTMAPIAVPVTLAAIALVAVIRGRLRRARTTADVGQPPWAQAAGTADGERR